MLAQVHQLARDIVDWIDQQHSDTHGRIVSRKVIGIAGIPGSGKTSIASKIEAHANSLMVSAAHGNASPRCIVMPMDGFHMSRQQLSAMPDAELAFKRRGAHWTFDCCGTYPQSNGVVGGGTDADNTALLQVVKRIKDTALLASNASIYAPGWSHEYEATEIQHIRERERENDVIVLIDHRMLLH
jgi:pantothenate kinase